MKDELYKRYRPKMLMDVVGQDGAVESIQSMLKNEDVPHAILFSGPSGCGKTTLARILKDALNCSKYDFTELNSASLRGIDDVRSIQRVVERAPMKGDCRVWIIDECHRMTTDAQSAMLKTLEDPPTHAYFLLCTTEPSKLLRTIRTRCMDIKVNPLADSDIKKVISAICKKEKKKLPTNVLEKIVENSGGSARQAVVYLQQVVGLKSTSAMLEAIVPEAAQKQGIDIARAIFSGKRWSDMVKVLRNVTEDPETIRRIVLGYARTILLSGNLDKARRAYDVIEAFGTHFFDSGNAGLAGACFELFETK